MQVFGAMGDRLGKGKWHPRRKQKYEKGRTKKLRIGLRMIYGRYFSVSPLSRSGKIQFRGVNVSNVTIRLVRGRPPLACLQLWFYL